MSALPSPAEQRWREIIERQGASGSTAAAFCRENRIAASSFFARKRRLGRSAGAPTFVEATVAAAPSAPSAPSSGRRAGVIEVRLRGGRRVRVGLGFDPDLLADVVAALEGLPPKAIAPGATS